MIHWKIKQTQTGLCKNWKPLFLRHLKILRFSSIKANNLLWKRFTGEGLELGRSDSPFITKLGNEKLSFVQDGVEVAYVQHNKLFITEAQVTNRLSIGDNTSGCFDWYIIESRKNGTMQKLFDKVGRENFEAMNQLFHGSKMARIKEGIRNGELYCDI